MSELKLIQAPKSAPLMYYKAMGLSVSDAIRLLMPRIAEEHCLPFEVKVPNSLTKKAIIELEKGKSKTFFDIKSLMADLHEDN